MLRKIFIISFIFLSINSLQAQNVGIGTTTPNQKLDIANGRLRFTGNPGPAISQGIEFTNPAGTNLNGFLGTYNDSITGMYGFQGSYWSFLHNNKNGNVGLQGNSNPRAALSFANTLGNKVALWGNADEAHYGIGIQNAQMQLYTNAISGDITFGYGSSSAFTENMRIKGNGNVGIGTASPGAKLDIVGRLQTSEGANLGGNVDVNGKLFAWSTISTDGSLFVSDNATIDGTIKIAGGSPGEGKVLTSDASGNATWKSAAGGITERFGFNFSIQVPFFSGNLITAYNTGSAVASVDTYGEKMFVSITKPGLYHFDVSAYVNPEKGREGDYFDMTIRSGTGIYPFEIGSRSVLVVNPNGKKTSLDQSFDFYIPETTTLVFGFHYGPNCIKSLTVLGYKIAD